jgi:hypothetical protein
MSPRIASILVSAVFLLVAPTVASAQAPPDERANARAFAAIALRLATDFEAAAVALQATIGAPTGCLAEPRLARRIQRAPKGRAAALTTIEITQGLGAFMRTIDPAVRRAVTDMHAIPTADPGLRGGRTAWRRIKRVYASLAALPAVDVCAEAREFVRNGYRRSAAMRQAQRTLHAAEHTGGIDRRLARAVTRLEALGVPAADADLFDGSFSD